MAYKSMRMVLPTTNPALAGAMRCLAGTQQRVNIRSMELLMRMRTVSGWAGCLPNMHSSPTLLKWERDMTRRVAAEDLICQRMVTACSERRLLLGDCRMEGLLIILLRFSRPFSGRLVRRALLMRALLRFTGLHTSRKQQCSAWTRERKR